MSGKKYVKRMKRRMEKTICLTICPRCGMLKNSRDDFSKPYTEYYESRGIDIPDEFSWCNDCTEKAGIEFCVHIKGEAPGQFLIPDKIWHEMQGDKRRMRNQRYYWKTQDSRKGVKLDKD